MKVTPPAPDHATAGTPRRAAARAAFVAGAGWSDAEVTALPGDASFRRYYRLCRGAERALVMDAPPAHEEVRPFVVVAEYLIGLGLSAPRIYACDAEGGFLLIEDLGDATYTRLLAEGADETTLYARAVDLLVALHAEPRAAALGLPPYDRDALLAEAALLVDWLVPAKLGHPCAARASYLDAWCTVFAALPPPATSLVLRDYHVDNLMRVPGRSGIAACGLLDFQDAVIGARAYDLVSLLEDARRDLGTGLATSMYARYLAAFPDLERTNFAAWYGVLGAQRHAKVAGIFVRLARRDGKRAYLRHIPRVLRLLRSHLREPALAAVKDWFDVNLPELETRAQIESIA